MHNRREYEKYGMPTPDNIDVSRSSENITLIDRDIRVAYREIFGEALEAYNSKQKRADRKIQDYYEHIKKSKNGEKLFYEDVIQWGAKDDFLNAPETRLKARDALVTYVEGFEERNPNLKLIGAYIHLDEASPHLHLDYIPVARGYSRGLEIRNSLDRAMKQMGFQPEKESKRNNATKLWKENERTVFGQICRDLGLEVEEERTARGSLSVAEYKEARDKMVGEIEQEYVELKDKVRNLDDIGSLAASEGQEALKVEEYTIEAKKSILGALRASERVGVFIEGVTPGQVQSLVQRVHVEEGIEARSQAIIAAAKEEARMIRAEATAERNETIAAAKEIVKNQQSIIEKAKEWAKSIQQKYQALVAKVEELLGRKAKLETEIKDLRAQRTELEPVRQEMQGLKREVRDLQRSKAILIGDVEKEITKAKFYSPPLTTKAQYEERFSRLHEGTLLALYNDGTLRTVKEDSSGRIDYVTFTDENAGRCRVGWLQDEERVPVPRSLMDELLSVRDISKPISQNLENLISQQELVTSVTERIKASRIRDDDAR